MEPLNYVFTFFTKLIWTAQKFHYLETQAQDTQHTELTSTDAFILLSLPFHNTEQLLQTGRATIQLEPNSLGQSLQSMLTEMSIFRICFNTKTA